ncbi:MAG: BamA/TamA family outer membrane protein [Cyclonatronaceae bacterium]
MPANIIIIFSKAIILIICSAQAVTAQSVTDVLTDSTYTAAYKNINTILPAIGATPETGLLFGGVVMRQSKPGNAGADTRSSVVLASAIYTTKNQLLIGLSPYIIFPEERWIMEGGYQYQRYPDSFWGIGKNSDSSDELIYEYRQWELVQSVQRKIGINMFMGPIVRWSRISDVEFSDTDGNLVSKPRVNGTAGSISSGAGFIYQWDARNSVLTPTRNHLVKVMVMSYPGFMGTTHPYIISMIDKRKYFDFQNDGKRVAAFNLLSVFTSGNPAFTDYPSLGGESILRGYYYGRFRDNNTLQIQAEYRQYLFWRLGITSFISAGTMWSRFHEFSLSDPKNAGGFGLRFNLNKNDTTNLRIDYGVGKNVSGFYLTFGEAF